MKNVAAALVKAQKQFGAALKTSSNPHFKSKYADLAACVEAVIDALNDNGLFLSQINYECSDGVIVETQFIHESGEVYSAGKLHVPAAKNDPQGYGSALTYARRYSLMAACGIAPEDDDGNAASQRQAAPKPAPQKPAFVTAEQAANLQALADEVGADMKAFLAFAGAKDFTSINAGSYSNLVKALEAKREKAAA